jgi:hypothetical protein
VVAVGVGGAADVFLPGLGAPDWALATVLALLVTAQLIEAQTDRHLWAETYDRDLDDIFAVQSDVVQQIAKALRARLAPAVLSHISARPSHDMKAYDPFVRARQDLYSVRPERIVQTIDQLEEAVALDPAFAETNRRGAGRSTAACR